ncbi:HIT domain-containing protein [Rothia sp. LK2588]|uniref:HIT family protein n=1 Tax=Rothia sp. LK2588 TaxID=3114369 RepID=UPI0034CE449A
MCTFCDIVDGKISSYKIFEDSQSLVFLDIHPEVPGYMLAIPKKHVVNYLDADSVSLLAVNRAVQTVGRHLVEVAGYDGFNVLNANGQAAEQSEFHLHLHILPRRHADGLSGFPQSKRRPQQDLSQMWESLKLPTMYV